MTCSGCGCPAWDHHAHGGCSCGRCAGFEDGADLFLVDD